MWVGECLGKWRMYRWGEYAGISKGKKGPRAFMGQVERCVNVEHVSADNTLAFTLSWINLLLGWLGSDC
jgi:hypothetical protein